MTIRFKNPTTVQKQQLHMKNINLKSLLPIITGIVIFIVLTFGYFSPMMKGKVIVMSDMVQNKGMSKEISDFREKNHSEPLWTNSMFGGMPAYQISIRYPNNLLYPLREVLGLGMPSPAINLFNYLVGFFILLLVLRVNPWLAIVGSVAYAFSAYNIILLDAGHLTATLALGYYAPVLAGVILIFRQKYLLGGVLLSIFMALELLSSHIQNTYYLCILLLVYVLFEWVQLIRKKEYGAIFKSFGVFAVAGILALGCNITNIWNTYDYGKYTIRGKSELTSNKQNQTSGLDRDYATQWSLGKSETMTLLIPSFKGSSSSISIAENKSVLKDVDPQLRQNVGGMGQYWGDQPFTVSPYAGAIIVFLFIFGMFIVKGRLKWALFFTSILAIMLSWGHNFMWLTDLFFDYFPLYNKFRAVSSILLLAEFAIPVIAILAIDQMIKNPGILTEKIKLALKWKGNYLINKEITTQTAFLFSFAITGGLSLLFYLIPSLTDFTSASDLRTYESIAKSNGEEIARQFFENVEIARKGLFQADALRSFFFVVLGAGVVWLYLKSKLNTALLIALLGVFILVDLWSVDKRYLNDKNFTDKRKAENPFPFTDADKAILEDKDPNYRVLNLTVKEGPFNDASTSYYHKSIGGYHAAKIRRYQELIDAHIQNNIQDIITTANANPSDSSIRSAFSRLGVLNMLNTRYIIYNPSAAPWVNRYALGNVWFVKDIKMVKNADEEIKTVGEINPATTVVVDERYKEELSGFVPKIDPSATIQLTNYLTNNLKYESNTTSEQLAVFSEIYFKEGWNAYVDGELKPYFAGNYVLRVMRVPAGKHTIEFKFEPQKYYTGEKISLASCLTLFVMALAALFFGLKKEKKAE